MSADQLTADEIRDFNTRYHDTAASSYDAKWGIDYGAEGHRQVVGKLRKALGGRPLGPFERSLEIGAGTGYFTLNLLQAGVVREAVATDISPGMLATLSANAANLGRDVHTRPPGGQSRGAGARRRPARGRGRVGGVRGRHLRPRLRARGPAPPTGPAAGVLGV